MRRKTENVLSFECNDKGLPKVVRDYRDRYRTISQVLDKNSEKGGIPLTGVTTICCGRVAFGLGCG